ncbi:Pentatricopeptide repeat-containing protein, mitochondrial, partial [Cucurbita argyrosperma subsp. argyrosperma]
MCQNDIHLDHYTYCSVFNAIAESGKKVHAQAIKSGLEWLMRMLNVDRRMMVEERDLVPWTTLVTAYSQCFEWDKAIEIFSNMRREGFTPNQFSFSSMLVSCASLCLLEYVHKKSMVSPARLAWI